MKELEERIRKDGIVREGNVLKVDSFINHQMDIDLFERMAQEWKRLFADCPINKILTIEASGIGIAAIAAREFHVPVVFAKKSMSINLDNNNYRTKIDPARHPDFSGFPYQPHCPAAQNQPGTSQKSHWHKHH